MSEDLARMARAHATALHELSRDAGRLWREADLLARTAERGVAPASRLAALLDDQGWRAQEWSLGGGIDNLGVRITFEHSSDRDWYALIDQDVAWADSETLVWRIGFYDERYVASEWVEDEGAQVLDLCRSSAPVEQVAADVDNLLRRSGLGDANTRRSDDR